ncbi:enoyl-CoA hydratase-related protein [Nocardioides sp. LS1]|uniref:enoyl-CoA hydratase-related protein n=1 Tax=Nocardioides sp. LS1 TaxID=1027620 RepID=UPI000F62273F|nr:enoyl-CoA hydratase-related protein [Nocardioides sp. LS1]GCD91116.1 putative enoyl-CoA hydratase [Nocardioides sp. LS1]
MGVDTGAQSSVRTSVNERVATVTIDRPDALNALSEAVMRELTDAAVYFDADPSVGAIVITGANGVFAAGGDIKEMQGRSFSDLYNSQWFAAWDRLTALRTPTIAAVPGFALGGGCELAMLCDIIVAADTAKFGQPEVKLGIPPGIGGSQRLARAIGKSKAMEMCLTGRMMGAEEAERSGLVSRVVPADELQEAAHELAREIASKSSLAVASIKDCINRNYETSLSEGVLFERRAFYAAFATQDQKEGMAAFIEKRPANFVHR